MKHASAEISRPKLGDERKRVLGRLGGAQEISAFDA